MAFSGAWCAECRIPNLGLSLGFEAVQVNEKVDYGRSLKRSRPGGSSAVVECLIYDVPKWQASARGVDWQETTIRSGASFFDRERLLCIYSVIQARVSPLLWPSEVIWRHRAQGLGRKKVKCGCFVCSNSQRNNDMKCRRLIGWTSLRQSVLVRVWGSRPWCSTLARRRASSRYQLIALSELFGEVTSFGK